MARHGMNARLRRAVMLRLQRLDEQEETSAQVKQRMALRRDETRLYSVVAQTVQSQIRSRLISKQAQRRRRRVEQSRACSLMLRRATNQEQVECASDAEAN